MADIAPDLAPRWSLDPCVRHLNHGSFGAVPEAAQLEQERLRRLMEWNPVRWFASLPERIAHARHQMADILRVAPDQLAFVFNASAGASVIYKSLLNRRNVDVMVTNHGYGAVTMGAQLLAERTGGELFIANIPLAAAGDTVLTTLTADLEQHQPTLLVIDQITSATARAFPVDEICQRARELGVTTLVDGAHAPGTVPDPVCREADYWVGNLHKFVCAPKGSAVLVCRDPRGSILPLIDSWGTQLDYPYRFDHAGTLDVTAWLTAPYTWNHIEETIGWPTVRLKSTKLLDDAIKSLSDPLSAIVTDPAPDVGQSVGPMRLVRLPKGLGTTRQDADDLRLPFGDQTGIAAAFTSFESQGFLRISAHIYNSIHDYHYLAKVGIPLLHQWSMERANRMPV